MPSQQQRREATRQRIIEAAIPLFARDGYAKTSLAEVVTNSGVTTGAIYHHFNDKLGLFVAVAEHVEQMIVEESAAFNENARSPWQRFENNVLNTLEICARPDIQRIVFRDAPTVIGFYEWREIEMKYGFGLLQAAIAKMAKEGVVDAPDPDLTAHILLGAIMQAAHFAALAKNKDKALKQGQETVRKLLRSLKLKKSQ